MENEELFRTITGKHPVHFELKEKLNEVIKRELYTKSQIILKPGQTANRAWYIQKGAAMGYIHKEEKKVPFWFWNEGQLMIPVNSFLSQTPSDIYIELLEPSTLISLSYDHVQDLTQNYPEADDYVKQILHEYHQLSQKRILYLTALTPEEHYLKLMQECPFIFLKASVENVAAYLGISRKTLNRIRTRTRRY